MTLGQLFYRVASSVRQGGFMIEIKCLRFESAHSRIAEPYR